MSKQPHFRATSFFLRNNHQKDNVAIDTFLNLGDISNYLPLKISPWKRGCKLSFELHITQTSSTPLRRALIKFYQGK